MTLKSIWNAIVEDIRTDFIFIKQVCKGTYKWPYDWGWKEFWDFKPMLKNRWTWIMLWIIILAFCVGYYYASQRYQDICNIYIIENFANITREVAPSLGINISGL